MLKLDGRIASKARLLTLKAEVEELTRKYGRKPSLTVVRVGDDPASELYVSKKIKTCIETGMESREIHLPQSTSQQALLELIDQLNLDGSLDGILVQLPLPEQIDSNTILNRVSPLKDVDGFHPQNLGRLVARDSGAFVACTPLGIMRLLEHYKISVEAKFAVVMGRSRIVGRPMSLLLDHAGATVCVVHLHTKSPQEITKMADILVVAIGKPQLIGGDYIKKGAVVIDVGTHRLADGKVVGDTKANEIAELASAASPVPGGVGPMTICSLLENCVLAFKQRVSAS